MTEQTALSLTDADITALIESYRFETFGSLTICLIHLTNGEMVTGESRPLSDANFDEQRGKDAAYRKARDKIWELEGYAVRRDLARQTAEPMALYVGGDKVTGPAPGKFGSITQTIEAFVSKEAMDLAGQLNGSGYNFDLTSEQLAFAKEHGLVVVTGASDDLMEFYGAFRDEAGAYDRSAVLVDAKGILPDRDDIDEDEDLKDYFARQDHAKTIEARWEDPSPEASGFTWSYKTAIPHATFAVRDGDEKYCRGIVFALADLQPRGSESA